MLQRRVTILLAALIVVAIGYALLTAGTVVPEHSVLVVELSGELPEAPADGLTDRLRGGTELALPTLMLQLRKAQEDPRIEGVLLHIRGMSLGAAQRRELHDAVAALRDAGTQVVALLDFARIGASTELYVASAANRVYVVPGFLGPLTGLAGEFTLLGGLAERLGVAVEYERIGAYKSAPESYASSELSAPARRMYGELMDGLYGDLVATIATGRGIEEARLRELIDHAPGTAEEWVEAGLADGVAGREQILEMSGWGELEELQLARYLHVDPRELGLRTGPGIALIFGEGAIVPGDGSRFAADRVTEALREAAEDDSLQAIVLRINSGGGSALASEQIWRAVRDARKQKPVVVSMGDAAASGGYYVASAANAIVAQPTTQTGSIGVFILRPSIGGLFEKLGVQTEVMRRGELAGLTTSTERLSDGQRDLLRQLVRASYEEFLARVAEGREMSREQVDEVGQGRVWLGARAAELGLVDELGGIETAIRRAKQASGIGPDVDPERVIFPKPRPLAQELRDLLNSRLAHSLLGGSLPGIPASLRGILALREGPALLAPYSLALH